ncbi:MAG TPA: RNA polymerase sigma factor [Devosiaceae bacterium]
MTLAELNPGTAPEELAESDLVAQARAGQEMAVRELIRRNNRRLFRVARAVLRNDAEAEDVVQETYVRAFTQLDGFRGDSSMSTWLTRIALNEALGRLRRQTRQRISGAVAQTDSSEAEIIMFPTVSGVDGPETALARGEIRKLLEQAIDTLPEAFRMVFVLREVEDMSTEEVATQLGIKPETVKTRLFRARRLIRDYLEDRLSGGFERVFPFDGERCVAMADRVVARLRNRLRS